MAQPVLGEMLLSTGELQKRPGEVQKEMGGEIRGFNETEEAQCFADIHGDESVPFETVCRVDVG